MTHFVLSVYIDAEGNRIDDSAEVYIDGELQSDVLRASTWKHYADAEIDYFCDAHPAERIHYESPCKVCGRVMAS